MKNFFMVIIILLGGLLYLGNNSVVISRYKIKNKKIPKGFNGFKILHISDLHSKVFYKNNEILVKKIKKEKPDIIVITGDLINRRTYNEEKPIDLINRIKDIAPIYYVTGNHEGWSCKFNSLENKLKKDGVKVLRNEAVYYKKGNDKILIAGVDDPAFNTIGYSESYRNNQIMKNQIEKINNGKSFKILLSHRPELFKLYVDSNIDLVFTGHAHGGQVIIPFIGGIIAPNQGFHPKYYKGTYKENNTEMVVSRGIGNSTTVQRIGNRPELVVVTFTAENKN